MLTHLYSWITGELRALTPWLGSRIIIFMESIEFKHTSQAESIAKTNMSTNRYAIGPVSSERANYAHAA